MMTLIKDIDIQLYSKLWELLKYSIKILKSCKVQRLLGFS